MVKGFADCYMKHVSFTLSKNMSKKEMLGLWQFTCNQVGKTKW